MGNVSSSKKEDDISRGSAKELPAWVAKLKPAKSRVEVHTGDGNWCVGVVTEVSSTRMYIVVAYDSTSFRDAAGKPLIISGLYRFPEEEANLARLGENTDAASDPSQEGVGQGGLTENLLSG